MKLNRYVWCAHKLNFQVCATSRFTAHTLEPDIHMIIRTSAGQMLVQSSVNIFSFSRCVLIRSVHMTGYISRLSDPIITSRCFFWSFHPWCWISQAHSSVSTYNFSNKLLICPTRWVRIVLTYKLSLSEPTLRRMTMLLTLDLLSATKSS